MTRSIPFRRQLAWAGALLLLSGCSTFSRDGGMDEVDALTSARIGQPAQLRPASAGTASDAAIAGMLSGPLTANGAVQLALLNNRGLHASLQQLGIAEADLVQAGWMNNPSISFGRKSNGHETEVERAVMFDIIGLLTIPLRGKIESQRFGMAKIQAAAAAVRLAADTRRAYFSAVAAQQSALYADQVRLAAEASAELATRMAQVGNISKLNQAREQAFYADATAQVARARHQATATRERLARLLGLWGDHVAMLQLPDRLPDLPKSPSNTAELESHAMRQRLDIALTVQEAAATARSLGLSRTTRFINVLHAGYANTSASGEPRANGYEIELALPLFDWGGARTAKAEAIYMQSVHRTADTAVRARSEVREAYSAYRTTYDLAKHYQDEVVPLRKKISDEMLLRYNGMLIGVFELLADARMQVGSVNAAIEAQRDFWIAETDLQAAVNGSGGALAPLGQGSPAAAEQAH